MESYHKMDIESLDRKMKENHYILRDIYLIMIVLTTFVFFIFIYLLFDKYNNITPEYIMPMGDFYV